MDYEMITIFNQKAKIGNNKYNFIIEEKNVEGWGKKFCVGRAKPKFYSIKKNGKTILHTTLHQTFYKERKTILGR